MTRFYTRRIVFAFATGLALATVVAAQSGRRGTAKSTAPSAPSVSDSKNETKPQKPPRLQLLVGVEEPGGFDQVPFYLADTVLDACVQHLDEAEGVIVRIASRRMTRGEAIKAAKAETERYVVWLQVRNEFADSGAQVRSNANELYVSYMILEPGTARIKQTGRAQHGIYKVGNVGVGGPTSSRRSPAYSEYAIRQAAREAAEKILAAFGIRVEGPWPR